MHSTIALVGANDVGVGCVPGPKNQIIRVQDARGKPWPKGPMSTAELKPEQVLAEAGVPDATEATTVSA